MRVTSRSIEPSLLKSAGQSSRNRGICRELAVFVRNIDQHARSIIEQDLISLGIVRPKRIQAFGNIFGCCCRAHDTAIDQSQIQVTIVV